VREEVLTIERHKTLIDMLNSVRRLRASLLRLGDAQRSDGAMTSTLLLPLGASIDDAEEEILSLISVLSERSS